MIFYFVLSSYTLCSIESLGDYSCAIATPAGRGKLEQPHCCLPKLFSWLNGTACLPSCNTKPSRVAIRQDPASPHMFQMTNNAIVIRFFTSLSRISNVYVCLYTCTFPQRICKCRCHGISISGWLLICFLPFLLLDLQNHGQFYFICISWLIIGESVKEKNCMSVQN